MSVTSSPESAENGANLDPIQTSSGLTAEMARRLDNIAALRAQGTNPYPYRFDRTHTLGELREMFSALEAGIGAFPRRIMVPAIRLLAAKTLLEDANEFYDD